MPYPSTKFRQNPFTSLRVIRRTDRQTDRTKNITSFFGGGNKGDVAGSRWSCFRKLQTLAGSQFGQYWCCYIRTCDTHSHRINVITPRSVIVRPQSTAEYTSVCSRLLTHWRLYCRDREKK